MKMNISMFSNFLLYLRVHLHGFIVARSVGACRCLPVLQPTQTCFADRPQITHRFNCDWLKSEVVHKREKCEKA